MAFIRSLDENGDWLFGRSKADYLNNRNAVRQNLETRLMEYKNDWFNDEDKGIDYDFYLTNKQTQKELENAIRNTILTTEDVADIISFDTELNNRELSIRVRIQTIYSDTLTLNLNV
jgi:hypothetical protein